jgi:hypothetical protein
LSFIKLQKCLPFINSRNVCPSLSLNWPNYLSVKSMKKLMNDET